ncbi:hypothetical protein A3C09_04960 [Candidatus Uhrbacteria bacterium RIFCSPHIGHO2_02_FULL_47_44]|uniref:Uncharacterized protein n=1 Tax=Candidatus Uhrbacteria bacterium RIFCSPLOWO2_02_FULL_48_18 TaxID=1802408 RepID=A0A1F7V885_9BACT|nr:MAG: hypothetical protein A2839_04665 [Candidatus Uhrbacteria bacterium RIFCSPHIGHO2_01_FULL_47_10]OGL70710.1 MAG: hypothetical protein A3C09_04960 [Candidatus Uhrbacteria bacterium RIFCSPHIGHO2_02_FULL_47_44]OGL77787.1 MAG: hypothetical protein A3E97_01005 [Candidatus Uhrbacteria bacterium RIFCSPHIGHO2_12_FULL_47_12]OGL82285.1 MAG: hypothetical protein A3B20_00845 [Candidatus Uhrbacteria bacterium RIFCSPLOWO2_01_FULL_47_17]OGL86776.1 MAG: hypothetical protein A3I41_05565 [Candidatus Uhrbact
MKSSSSSLVLKHLLLDLVREILFLPVWWFTIGLAQMVLWCGHSVKHAAETTGLTIWAKNLFVPMYGETSVSGKLISFFVRLIMVIARGVATFVWMFVVVGVFIAYLLLLPLAILGIFYHGLGMVFV